MFLRLSSTNHDHDKNIHRGKRGDQKDQEDLDLNVGSSLFVRGLFYIFLSPNKDAY